MKKCKCIMLIISITLSFIGCIEKQKETKTDQEKLTNLEISTVNFEIAKIEDKSRKTLEKPLSQYEVSEIEKLATNKKILYRIVLSEDIKENQVRPTVEKIIKKLTADDTDIDEIILWLYSNKEMLNGSYDIGTAIWAPYGKLGNINTNIARSNIRDSYEIEYQITKNLNEYLAQKSKSEIRFGFSEEERKQIFKEIVNAEDNANEYERIEQDKVIDRIGKLDETNRDKFRVEFDEIKEKTQKIMSKNKSKVFKKYNITKQQEKEIIQEGLEEKWPFE